MVLLESAVIILETTLVDYAPVVVAKNPFKDKHKKRVPLWPNSGKRKRQQPATVGKVQLVKVNTDANSAGDSTYWLRFLDVRIRNEKNLPCFVLLSRSNARSLSDEASMKALEANAQTILLDDGPEGQWKGCHMSAAFDQEICVFDPLAFASVMVCKPSAAKPPSALPLVFAYGAFQSYVPPEKSAEQVALEMEALSAKLLGTVMEIEQEALQGDEQLSLDALQRSAKQLFKMFDLDGSNSIDFDEYRQMLTYRKINLKESKARRYFQLVDVQKKWVRWQEGYIDEREFVIAMYITNYLRLHTPSSPSKGSPALLSPVDVFHQLDADRDERLNVFEYEKALELLGVINKTSADSSRARQHFPKNAANIDLEQFESAWLQLVDVKSELKKRGITAVSTQTPVIEPDHQAPLSLTQDQRQDNGNGVAAHTDHPTTTKSARMFSTLSLVRSKNKELDQMRTLLLDAIKREEQEELQVALKARDEVIQLEKAHREAEQEEKRILYNQQRHAATSTRTNEALRERQEKITRKKERAVKERQAKEERRLLAQIAEDVKKRTSHQMRAVQEHMASKMDKITLQKARCGDDVLDLCGQRLKEFPPPLYHGRDSINALSSLLIMNLSRNRLRVLPSAIFSHLFMLQALDVSDNELVELPVEISEAHDLQTLDAHSNQLQRVPDQMKHLHNLKVLNLAFNHLQTFGACCDGLSALEELDLTSNCLTSIAESIGFLSALQRLRLRGNPALKLLPKNIQQLSALVSLDLSACEQKRISADVFGPLLASLRTLNLAHNTLSTLPIGVGKLKKLQELNVARNVLLHYPSQLCELRELVVLDARNNKLEVLPDEFGHLLALESLTLASNRLVALPPTLGLITGLQRIDLQHNRLLYVPLEIGALVNLRSLDLSWNELSELPEEIGCLASLRQLNLSHNRISHLPEAIMLWQSLEMLSCSHNWLATPLTASLQELQTLQYIDFSHNQLSQLEACIYELANLEVLNLASNQIEFLPKELATAACSTKLKKLDLYNNKLAALPIEMAQLLPRLEVFSVERNPMKLLPDKWSDHWRLEDRYKTSCMKGYTPVEVTEWVHDQNICYPAIVSVWNQLTASSPSEASTDPTSPSTEHAASTRPAANIGSDEFLKRVCAVMGETMWQNRFERVVRYYYYEFKHLGHAVLFDDIALEAREQFDTIESEHNKVQQQRANDAIDENNAFRAHLEQTYRVDLERVMANAIEKRRRHEQKLLSNLRHETQQLNDVVGTKYAQSLAARELQLGQQRTHFAMEMKLLAREKQMQRLARKEEARHHLDVLGDFSDQRADGDC